MTPAVERPAHHRRLLVALIAAVLALVVGIGAGVDAHASTAAGQVAGTRVAAHELLAGPVVAASEDIAAGEGRRTTTLAPDVATGLRVAPNTAALTRYDPDFAIGQLTSGGQARASQLVDLAESQGWKRLQSQTGPIKYVDENGIERIVLKSGSSRTTGSGDPHIAIRDSAGLRVNPYGNPVSRRSPGNHTPIEWDLP